MTEGAHKQDSMSEQREPHRADAPGGPAPAAEPDRPPSARILGIAVVLSAVVALAVLGLWELFTLATAAEVYRLELAPESPELAEVRARDEGRLRSYAVLDPDAGRYQIPIDRAMMVLVANPELLKKRPANPDPADDKKPQGAR